MFRIVVVGLTLIGAATLANASTAPSLGDIGGTQIAEAKKCKKGFRLNKRGRCVAKPRPNGGSGGGSFDGDSSGGGSH